MKNLAFTIIILLIILSCKDKSNNNLIKYSQINKDIILITNIGKLQASNDATSQHVDSILSGLINTDIISTGSNYIDLDFDNIYDVNFEIIDLNLFNNNNLPDTLDSLAARVLPEYIEILDNSTYGYPDALNYMQEINSNGYWSTKHSVLGTFLNAGQFQGKGEKYLAFRKNKNGNYNYGWVKLYCSQHNDTLKIIDFAINLTSNNKILAGKN